MKFLTALLILASSIAHAESRLELGAGLAVSGLSVTPSNSAMTGHTGLTVGARLDSDLSGIFSFETGLGYVPKGFNVASFNQVIHYLDVPLMVKARLPMLGEITPFVSGGLGVGYEATTYSSILIGMLIVKSFDLTMNVAGGFEYPFIAGYPTFLRVGYSLGLLNAIDQDAHPGAEAKTKALLITTGISIPLAI